MFVSAFRAISAVFMAIATLISFPVAGNISAPFAPKDEDNVRLYFATLSDTHFNSSPLRVFMMQLGLADMQEAAYPLDALVHAGDITDHAYEEDWENCANAFTGYSPAKEYILQKVITILGLQMTILLLKYPKKDLFDIITVSPAEK